jgi:sugar-specific transcriptional regulator TrmB
MYQELLRKLGLDDKEIAVFITVLEQGKITPATVATITGINRSTVYSISKVLSDKGILTIDTTSEPIYLVIESAEVLKQIILKEERLLIEKKEIITESIKVLENIPKSKNYSVPKIRFYNEREINDTYYQKIPIWVESALQTNEPSWWGFQDVSLVENFPKWITDNYKLVPENFSTHIFTNANKPEKDMHLKISDIRRTIKYLDKKQHKFTATQVVLGDYIIYVMTNEKPYYMIEIHDRVMAHNLRETFKLLWEKL